MTCMLLCLLFNCILIIFIIVFFIFLFYNFLFIKLIFIYVSLFILFCVFIVPFFLFLFIYLRSLYVFICSSPQLIYDQVNLNVGKGSDNLEYHLLVMFIDMYVVSIFPVFLYLGENSPPNGCLIYHFLLSGIILKFSLHS